MACITVNIAPSLKRRMEQFSWVNWSEVGRQEAIKRDILEGYIQNGRISAADMEFCGSVDWHPVDELPVSDDYVKKLKAIEKGHHGKRMSAKDLTGWFESL